MEDRQSFLPRRLGSTDHLSDSRRPSGTGPRSISAEPARASVAVGSFSRDSSATKLPLNRRSRSQQGPPSYGRPISTPLRNNQYLRPTTTPVRTPSGRRSRSCEACLHRALAVKDSSPLAFSTPICPPIRRASQLATLSEERIMITPPPNHNKDNLEDQITDLASLKTPPCVPRKKLQIAEKDQKDKEVLTEREKLYKPEVTRKALCR